MSRRLQRLQRRHRARPGHRRPDSAKRIGAGVVVLGAFGLLGWAWLANNSPVHTVPEPPSWLPKCPVGGGAVSFTHRASTADGPVFFCCEHCLERYRDDPSQYAALVREQSAILASLPRIQVACPVSDGPVSQDVHVEVEGRTILFCSPECREAYLQSPNRFQTALAESYWYQTRCPVDDMLIDPRFSTTLPKGETVYLCSDGCLARFTSDPTEFASQLAQQGLRLHLD